jgi:hypothetical protein
MRLVADGLTQKGFPTQLPAYSDSRRLTIAAPAARCTLSVEDSGGVCWDWQPPAGQALDPRHLADLASLLLTGQSSTQPSAIDPGHLSRFTLKGAVGHELAARGLRARMEICTDHESFDVDAVMVASVPGGCAEVRVTDDGSLSWEHDYWIEAARATGAPAFAEAILDPRELSASIVATVTQALAVACREPGAS